MSLTRDVVLELRPDNIEKVFHLPQSDNYYSITYEKVGRWYKEHKIEVEELIHK